MIKVTITHHISRLNVIRFVNEHIKSNLERGLPAGCYSVEVIKCQME